MILIARNIKNNRVIGLQIDGKLFKLNKTICHAIELDERKSKNSYVSMKNLEKLYSYLKRVFIFLEKARQFIKKFPPAKRVLGVVASRFTRAWPGAGKTIN